MIRTKESGVVKMLVRMAKVGVLFYANDEAELVEAPPANGTDYELEEAQGHVEGLVQVIRPIYQDMKDSDIIGLVNEEGMILGLDYNIFASNVFGYPIYGNMIMCMDNMLR